MGMIFYGPGTEHDLNEIWNYIAEDDVAAADNLIRSFDQKFHMLADRPLIGKVRYDLDPQARSFPDGNYVILYRAVPDGIEIVMIVHGARDIPAAFFDRLSHRSDRGTTMS